MPNPNNHHLRRISLKDKLLQIPTLPEDQGTAQPGGKRRKSRRKKRKSKRRKFHKSKKTKHRRRRRRK